MDKNKCSVNIYFFKHTFIGAAAAAAAIAVEWIE